MKSDFMIRQGDVMLFKIEEMLPEMDKVKPIGNNNILAYGEASGHAHAVRKNHSELYHANDNLRALAKKYGIKDERAVTHGLRIVVDNAELQHGTPTRNFAAPHDPDHTTINLPAGDYIVVKPREYSDDEEFRQIAD